MTREEAMDLCERMQREHPDRATHQWRAQELGAGEWSVLKVALPPADAGALNAEQRADERPPSGNDPRTSFERDVGSNWAIGG